jgi:serine/threonine protein kinase
MPDQDPGDSNLEITIASPGNIPSGQIRLGSVVGGSYRVHSIIGRGGMGVVYSAEHLTFQRNYALKALAPDKFTEANWHRFQSEGKAIARLEHRNIVKIYDMGIDSGECPFYVMDLLEGPSLAEFVRTNGPLTVDQAVEIFTQICAGLGYAHKCGIIHRDIKPSNIILTGLSPRSNSRTGSPEVFEGATVVVKIVDFGLAKLVGDMAHISQSQTATGEVFGSPYYMSPEQCLGGKVDERSDIYSLGCTLFECLTGSHPFRGANALETVMMHQKVKPSTLAAVRGDIEYSPVCEQLVALMLKKRPPERPQTMAHVSHDLERIKEGKSVKPRAIFADTPLYALEGGEDASAKSNGVFTGLILALCLLVMAGGASGYYYWNSVQKQEKLASALPAAVADPPDVVQARRIFSSWGSISSGANVEGVEKMKLFRFPPVPLGKLIVGKPPTKIVEAKDDQYVLPHDWVALVVMPPEGRYTLMFPGILAKIGGQDIDRLEIGNNLVEAGEVAVPELSPQIFQAISQWSGLSSLDIHGFKLSKRAIDALSQVKPVREVKLRRSDIDGAALAELTWLNRIVNLDITHCSNVNPVLKSLRGSTALRAISLDHTAPSMQGLDDLSTCPNLEKVLMSGCGVDDTKLEAICKISSAQELCLNSSSITGRSLQYLVQLKHLKNCSLKDSQVEKSDFDYLKRQMPQCNFEWP